MKARSAALGLVLAAAAARAAAQEPAGGNFIVNTETAFDQAYPAIGAGPDGRFVVVWAHGYFHLRGQRFDRAGQKLGGEFAVNSHGYADYARVAVRANGDFVVAWSQDSGGFIAAQIFAASGERRGAELTVSTNNDSDQIFPQVDVDGRGGFVVAWLTPAPAIAGFEVHAQRFDAAGGRLGGEFQASAATTSNLFAPAVAAGADGRFLVLWSAIPGTDGSNASVNAQRYDANGAAVGANFQVNTFTTEAQIVPSAAFAPDGSFVVAFESYQPGARFDVFARRYDASGQPMGGEFQVNTATSERQTYPDVAMDSAGNFVVAWTDKDGYVDMPGIHARRYRADGTARGPEFLVNTYTSGQQQNVLGTLLAVDAAGNFIVDWDGYTLGDVQREVRAQRYGGLHPQALEVDLSGNRVWEPGETVDVHPHWANSSGTPQAFAGQLTRLGGPGGATYTITAADGLYPQTANGSSSACTTCYAVRVTAPATRPALHWDASAVETLVPDTKGQARAWALHVGASFTDVPPASPFYRFVETLLHRSITGGCGGSSYCPGQATTRGQMPVFVLTAREGTTYLPPACGTPVFNDVPAASPFCRWVEELARRGVTTGCGGGDYCPNDPVSRDQMAVFLLRALDPALSPPACTTPLFGDVPASSPFCRWVEELARRGITAGCGGGNYCPGQPVTREQMAVFLATTFGLTLYGL